MIRLKLLVACAIAQLALTACSSAPPAAKIEVVTEPLPALRPRRPAPVKVYDEPWRVCGRNVCLSPDEASRSQESKVELRVWMQSTNRLLDFYENRNQITQK